MKYIITTLINLLSNIKLTYKLFQSIRLFIMFVNNKFKLKGEIEDE